jgi:hypothetical protein
VAEVSVEFVFEDGTVTTAVLGHGAGEGSHVDALVGDEAVVTVITDEAFDNIYGLTPATVNTEVVQFDGSLAFDQVTAVGEQVVHELVESPGEFGLEWSLLHLDYTTLFVHDLGGYVSEPVFREGIGLGYVIGI